MGSGICLKRKPSVSLIKGKVKPEISLGYCLSRGRYEHKRGKNNSEETMGTATKARVAGP